MGNRYDSGIFQRPNAPRHMGPGMAYTLAAHNIDELIGAFGQIAGNPAHHDGCASSIRWAERIGNGTSRLLYIRPDLMIFMYDLTLTMPINIEFRMPRPSLELSFCLHGCTRYTPRSALRTASAQASAAYSGVPKSMACTSNRRGNAS